MKHAPSVSIGLAACALVAATIFVATPSADPSNQAPAGGVTDDPFYGLFSQMCSKCHDAARIVGTRRNKFEWEEVLNKMIEKGATGTEKDFENVYDFLLRNYGKVDVNRAAADEIAMILGLSDKDAAAIVAYRKTNGAFADYDAVARVPDVDRKKLEAHKDALSF